MASIASGRGTAVGLVVIAFVDFVLRDMQSYLSLFGEGGGFEHIDETGEVRLDWWSSLNPEEFEIEQ